MQIGTSDLKELMEGNNYFANKSLLIKEFLENGAKIILILRPTKFGKILILSMLRYFFDIRIKADAKELFKNLKIENEIMKLQGEYNIVFLLLKIKRTYHMEILKMEFRCYI